jgi:anti-sigma B factor antagonist
VTVAGEVDLATAPNVRRHGDEASATPGVSLVVIDLGSCTYLDSAGLHALVDVVERASQRDKGVSMVGAVGIVRQVIEVANVEPLLAVLDR